MTDKNLKERYQQSHKPKSYIHNKNTAANNSTHNQLKADDQTEKKTHNSKPDQINNKSLITPKE